MTDNKHGGAAFPQEDMDKIADALEALAEVTASWIAKLSVTLGDEKPTAEEIKSAFFDDLKEELRQTEGWQKALLQAREAGE